MSELYAENCRRFFHHNVHGVRVLQNITNANLTLQTLDGILCHNGEKDVRQLEPRPLSSFEAFQAALERCYTEESFISALVPSTLEGCVVRVSDMIAYVWKDRQDAKKLGLIDKSKFITTILGDCNTEFINRIVTNIIKNSLGKNYVKMDDEVFDALKTLKQENSGCIYGAPEISAPYYEIVQPMMKNMYEVLYSDVTQRRYASVVFQHYLNDPIQGNFYRKSKSDRSIIADPNAIVVDFIASMTDDYFIDLYATLFPCNALSKEVKYIPYF